MGRWCYFDNGFKYKFYCGVQDSGFDYLEDYIGAECTHEHNLVLFLAMDCEDEDLTVEQAATKQEFICWAKQQGDNNVRHEDAPYRDNDPFWNELLDQSLDTDIEIFTLHVYRNDLLTHLQSYGYDLPNFSDYTTDLDGLNKLYEDLDNHLPQHLDPLATSNFTLACLLYHMSTTNERITGYYGC